jgi:putative ABC transport system permease protein
MLTRHFRDIILSVKRQPVSLLINTIGLGTAMAVFVLSFLHIRSELGMNRCFTESENIYRLSRNDGSGFQGLPARVGEIVTKSLPEALSFCRVDPLKGYHVIKIADKPFRFEDIISVDSSFFRIFDMPFVYGDPDHCLEQKFTMVISESTAEKYFPGENPVGKVIRLDAKHNFVITGVVSDFAHKASITGNAYISLHSVPLMTDHPELWDSFSSYNYETYLLLDELAEKESVTIKLNDLLSAYGRKYSIKNLVRDEYALTPLKKVYFINELRPDFPKGNSRQILIISSSSILLLLIAIINYSVLTIIKWKSQTRQLAIRRVLGANRKHIKPVFIGEAILISLISLSVCMIVVRTIEKPYGILIGSQHFESMRVISVVPLLVFFASILGLLAGVYSLSRFSGSERSPSELIKYEALPYGRKLITTLAVFQIITAISLTGCSLILHKQLAFIDGYELGFANDNILSVAIPDHSFDRRDALKEELLKNSTISNVSYSYSEIMANNIRWTFEKDGRDGELYADFVDNDYIETFGLSVLEGNNFRDENPGNQMLVNKTARERYFSEYPVGSRIGWLQRGMEFVGVIEDVKFQPFYNDAAPMALVCKPANARFCNIRLSGDDISSATEHIENVWNSFFDEFPFEYCFLDDIISRNYTNEKEMKFIGSVFSFISIVLVCLGAYTLVSLIAAGKKTELTIRKVNGASILQLVMILSRKINQVLFIAVIPSFIIIYFLMDRWLSEFAYHVSIPVSAFLLSSLLVFLFINLTVMLKIIKTAKVNPADELNR